MDAVQRVVAVGRLSRVAVAGHSMEPALRDGDWLVYERRAPRVGDVAVARDPRDERRWLVKRVGAVGRDEVLLTSDAPGHESLFVDRSQVIGRVALRYWPLMR